MWERKIPLITRQVQYINIDEGEHGIPLSQGKVVDLQVEAEMDLDNRVRHYAAVQHGEDVYDWQMIGGGEK